MEKTMRREMGALFGGPIPLFLDLQVSLLLPASEGKNVAMLQETSTWPAQVSGPCGPQGRKHSVVGECCEF